jgi:hypothetical protein
MMEATGKINRFRVVSKVKEGQQLFEEVLLHIDYTHTRSKGVTDLVVRTRTDDETTGVALDEANHSRT